jgi:hypothetical protein
MRRTKKKKMSKRKTTRTMPRSPVTTMMARTLVLPQRSRLVLRRTGK